ncbi:phosphatase PAP2 family protein [uncultured Vibrio sp.]|uniref:phosphatase PAP2 family protein n=1 Tax=uncultured Vibrio sp. TaxID=114054 RepID=UPI0025FF2F48|nr:phosphatase PAP2 family protein [uncultured Vibrio sp.]
MFSVVLFHPLFLLALLWIYFYIQFSGTLNWQVMSDVGVYGLVTTAIVFPAFSGDWEQFKNASLIVAMASGIGLIGKSLIDAKRPDLSGNDSFPSNHTANAFAASTALLMWHGWLIGILSYGLASLVGLGRVRAFKHHWRDVITGLAVGLTAAVVAFKIF